MRLWRADEMRGSAPSGSTVAACSPRSAPTAPMPPRGCSRGCGCGCGCDEGAWSSACTVSASERSVSARERSVTSDPAPSDGARGVSASPCTFAAAARSASVAESTGCHACRGVIPSAALLRLERRLGGVGEPEHCSSRTCCGG